MLHDFLVAMCLFMVIEGILPFISPEKWKNIMKLVLNQTDKNIRLFGLVSMLLGTILLYVIRI
jgi:uncharacterized protein YjeT (DUF2065 family)